MRSLEKLPATAPVLAEAAELLSGQLQIHLERFAKLLEGHVADLEQHFLERLRKAHFDDRKRKALAAITPGAAALILARGCPLADFFEQVEYNGRRLAKLNLSPGEVVHALGQYDALLGPILARIDARDSANFDWSREQLHFCTVLTLNNAYYQVREAETQAYYELFQAELESADLGEFLGRFIQALAIACRADTGRIYLLDPEARCWRLEAGTVRGGLETTAMEAACNRVRTKVLSRPRYFERGEETDAVLLDPGWKGRYQAYWSVPIENEGRLEGVMQFGFSKPYEWLPRELDMLLAAGKRSLRASEKARLAETLARREAQVGELARRMLQVEEVERRRISRELHDEAGQSLLCVRMQLEKAEQVLPELRDTRELVEGTIREIRRVIAALSPSVLEQLGLGAALRQLTTRFSQVYPAQLKLRMKKWRLPKQIETVVYRLMQEALNNIAKHSRATAVNISLAATDGVLKLRVEDDGAGFDVKEALTRKGSFGLMGMRERVALLGGKIDIRSRPGSGTRLQIQLPVREE